MNKPEKTICPQLVGHMYWNEKAMFQLKEDTNEYWVLFAVEEGSFQFEIHDKEDTALFGDLVLCPPGVVFRREVIKPLSFHVFLLKWADESERPKHWEMAVPYGKITIKDLNRLSSTYTYLRKWADIGGEFADQFRHQLLSDLWYLYNEEAHYANPSQLPKEHGRKDALIQKAVQIIQDRASTLLNLKALAAELGLTQVQLTRRFKKAIGMLPIDFLTSLRLQKVQKLLLDSDLTLQQIAGCCGYENEFYMSRVFKKRKQISPSQFRKLHRL